MSSDRDGNEVETVYDRGDLNDWMVERWKSEQRKSTPTERPPERFRLGVEPALSLQAPVQGPMKAPPQVRWPRGTAQAAPIRDDEPMPRARGSSPVIPTRHEDDNDGADDFGNADAGPLSALAAAVDAVDNDDAIAAVDNDDAMVDDEAEPLPEPPEVSRKHRPRHRRRDRPRSKTIAMKRLTREALRAGALANPPVEGVERPQTRAECRDMPRPCPWVACKHHLYLDINPKTGSIKINFPDLEPWELQHTCSLDIAENGGLTLEEIGTITNLTRERVRQVEVRGLLTLKSRSNSLK